MHTNASKEPAAVLDAAAQTVQSLNALRSELRRQSQPGDPDREARLGAGLVQQMIAMSAIRGLMARVQWETAKLTAAQTKQLSAVAKQLALERRQIKKMMRT